MPRFPGLRARSWTSLVMLLACFLSQAMPWPAFPGEAAGHEAAAVAIDVPQAKETCAHHPAGCPRDCLCPKDPADAGRSADPDSGPTLSRCDGKAAAQAPAPSGLFLTHDALNAARPEPFRYLRIPAPSRPGPGFGAGPGKIPIA